MRVCRVACGLVPLVALVADEGTNEAAAGVNGECQATCAIRVSSSGKAADERVLRERYVHPCLPAHACQQKPAS